MDIDSLIKRYSRYLVLLTEIKSGIQSRHDGSCLVVHERDDALAVMLLGDAPGEIIRIFRKKDKIYIHDLTACRTGEKDWDQVGVIDLTAKTSDAILVEDFFYQFDWIVRDATSRQRRWWEVYKLKMAAEDGFDEDELDD